ncbi:MAG: lactate racemase domain-containing protein [Pyramidobacter sp.]|jgi:hypothetical protein
MSFIDETLSTVPIPEFVRVRQNFKRPRVEDPVRELISKLDAGRYLDSIKPGMSIAVTAGSRGIVNYPLLVKTLVSEVKKRGGKPFIFPAMGSHGGATAEGQRALLAGLGISEETMGCPVRATMETVELGTATNGRPVYVDRYAHEADGIIIINRVKPHTGFRGKVESGICKMCAIGMGKQKGAAFCHAEGFGHMAENIPAMAAVTLGKENVLCGVALIENAYHETAQIEVMRADEVLDKEPELLRRAWDLMAKIDIPEFEVLVMDEIGKNISGTGFDTNVVGRYNSDCAFGGPKIKRVTALDITDVSHGNGNGIGMLDMTTRRAYEKFSMEQTYPNCITSTVPLTVKIPMVLKNDLQVFQCCIKTCNVLDSSKIRVIRIKNTLSLNEIEVSTSLIPEIQAHPRMEILSESYSLNFDAQGNLF